VIKLLVLKWQAETRARNEQYLLVFVCRLQ